MLEDRPEASGHEKEGTRDAELIKRQMSRLVPNRFVGAATRVCWLQLGNTPSILMKVNIKLSV